MTGDAAPLTGPRLLDGYDYTVALCRAIEDTTNAAVAQDPRIYDYRGVSLRRAVERLLYFTFINHEGLYTVFQTWRRGQLPDRLSLSSPLERTLAHSLVNRSIPIERLVVRPGPSLSNWKERAKRWVSGWYPPSRPVDLKRPCPPVLIHVIHPKFAAFLKPITQRLGDQAAYIPVLRPELKTYFSEQRMPFIEGSGKPLRSEPCSPVLRADFWRLPLWFDRVAGVLDELKPKSLVVVEGNSPHDEIVNQVCRARKIPIVCVQHGWSPIVHTGFRNLSYTRMLVWGDGFGDLLRPLNPEQRFLSVGHPGLDRPPSTSIDALLSRKTISFYLQALPSRMLDLLTWTSFLDLIVQTATEFSGFSILVREHPAYPLPPGDRQRLTGLKNVKLVPPQESKLSDMMNASRFTVSVCSTTILESISAGLPPVILNLNSLPTYFPDVQAEGAGVEVRDLPQALAAIRRLVTDDAYLRSFEPALQRFRTRYFTSGGAASAEQAARIILNPEA